MSKKIGNISFTTEGYEKFVSLSKKEQIQQVYNSLNPKDMVQAEKELKGVPNGDSSRATSETNSNNASKPSGGKPTGNTKKSEADK